MKIPHTPSPHLMPPDSRLGASRPSSTRIARMSKDVQAASAKRDETFSNPHYSGRELRKRRTSNALERKIYGGVAATAIAATGLLVATSQPRGEVNPVNPNQNAITKQATDNKNMANATAHEAAQAHSNQVDQADINQLQHEQAQLNRPPAK